MNIISGLCGQLGAFLNILSGREDRFDPNATLERLIEYCDIAMADLEVRRLREVLEDAAHESEAGNKTETLEG